VLNLAPKQFKERQAVRDSYYQMGQKWNFTYSLYFLLGNSDESGINQGRDYKLY